MAFAEETAMRAGLAVLERATVLARMLGYGGASVGLPQQKCQQLADLMDAVHNIPYLLTTWETCDESLLVAMLKDRLMKRTGFARRLPAGTLSRRRTT